MNSGHLEDLGNDNDDDISHGSPQRRAVAFLATLLMHRGDVPMEYFSSIADWGERQAFKRMRNNINDVWKKVTGDVLFWEVNRNGEPATRGSRRLFRLNHNAHLGATADTPAFIAAALSLLRPILEGTLLAEYASRFQSEVRASLSPQACKRFDTIQKKFHMYTRHPVRLDKSSATFNEIVYAVLNQHALDIEFRAAREKIQPLSIMMGSEGYYLVGVNWDDPDLTKLKTWRIDALTMARAKKDETFRYPAGYSPNTKSIQYFGFLGDPQSGNIKVKLRVHKPSQAFEYLSNHRLSRNEKWFRVSETLWEYQFEAPDDVYLVRTILCLGAGAQVLEPTKLRNAVTDELSSILHQYRGMLSSPHP
jgi:predicted DNA-binding transcriptional regulator YafY